MVVRKFVEGSHVVGTVMVEGYKYHLEMQNNRVYSALVQVQRSCLQRLSAHALFWVSFIHHKLPSLLGFPTQTAQILPLPRQPKFLPSNQGHRSESGE